GPVLCQYRQMIQWARDGRLARSQALRLGIIAGVPVADLAREFKVKTQAKYAQGKKYIHRMGERPIITAALAHPERDRWRELCLLAACNPGVVLLRELNNFRCGAVSGFNLPITSGLFRLH